MRFRYALGFIALSAFLAVGCGGGAGGGSSTPPTSDFAFGELSGRAAVSNPPVSTNSNVVIATAFTGTFSSLKIRELNPSLSETRIVASDDMFGPSLGIVNFAADGSDAQKVTVPGTNLNDFSPSIAANGKIVFERDFGGGTAIEMVNLDGSGLTQMVASGINPSIDAAGDKFAYSVSNTSLNVMNVATKAITPIPIANSGGGATLETYQISPDGSQIFLVEAFAGNQILYAVPSDGSNSGRPVNDLSNNLVLGEAVSPDGTEVAVLQQASPATVTRIGTGGGALSTAVNLPSIVADGLAYSADGKRLVVSTSNGGSAGLYSVALESSSFTRITPTTSNAEFPSWMPFLKDRTLIAGGGGLLGTRACGVILGQTIIGATTSVVAFDVTTPSSVVMTAQPINSLSATNLVFSVDADNITKLAYANTVNWRGIRAIGSGTPVTSANGALVSINGADGSVVSVLPFTGTRAAGSRPTVTDNGSLRTFSGSFLAVYDKDGKNLAPSGASVVTLDTKTGALSVQR